MPSNFDELSRTLSGLRDLHVAEKAILHIWPDIRN